MKEILQQVRDYLSVPERWGQGVNVFNEQKCILTCLSSLIKPEAGAWESKTYGKFEEIRDFLEAFIVSPLPYSVAAFNDTHTHVEVLELLDKAIAAA